MAKTYTIKKGDTLSEIAKTYSTTVAKLQDWNNIKNPNLIYYGEVIYVTDPGSSKKTDPKTKTSKVTVTRFGLQANTDNTVFVTWAWSKKHTDHYQVIWYYDTGNGVWFKGNDSTTKDKQSVYSAPSNAKRVKVKIKPVSTKHKVKKKDVSWWTGSWSTEKEYKFSSNPPTAPSTPSVELKNNVITAKLNNLDVNADYVRFQIVRDNKTTFKDTSTTVKIVTKAASYSCNVEVGSSYKVRCLAYSSKTKLSSPWSEYSDEYQSSPKAVSGITSVSASSDTSVTVSWKPVLTATSYEIEYTTNKKYFDAASSEVKSVTVEGTKSSYAIITGLESGQEYFFRLRSVNSVGSSAWTSIKSTIVGKKPAAPTTWSSSTTVVVGGKLTLYWNHNSEDGSSQTSSELKLIINSSQKSYTISGNGAYKIDSDGNLSVISSYTGDDKDKTTSCEVDISNYTEGAKIQWQVRTAGILKVNNYPAYGDWSVMRTVDVYASPTLELGINDKDGEALETLTIFPFYVTGIAGPSTQKVIGYHLSVIANSSYETTDQIGETKYVNEGDSVYSKYFETSHNLLVEMSAGNIDLENNIEYTVSCTVSMNSGLTADASLVFNVAWTDEAYEPNAEIGINLNDISAMIRPYCVDEDEKLIEDVTLAVYRREFDGDFVKLMDNIENTSETWIPDPHPALDYARYRIVATTKSTGAVSYYDMPGEPIGESTVVIQWDEEWSSYNVVTEDESEEPDWSGSMLKLPYNIDVSESNDSDVSLIKYIGRKHPVSYYGTHVGTKSTWNVAIKKDDEETIYALRRLAVWMGDVYVREPSGLGYWANIKVSFSQKHKELTIPVTLDITRVEGGM